MVTCMGEREICAVNPGELACMTMVHSSQCCTPWPPSLPTPSLQNVISEEVTVLVPWTFQQKHILSPFFWGGGTCEEVKSLLALNGKNPHIIKMEYHEHFNNNITSAQHVGIGRLSHP